MILGLALTKNQFVSNSSLPKSSLQGPLQFPTKSNGSPNKEGQMNHQLILYKVSPKVESDFLIRESFPNNGDGEEKLLRQILRFFWVL